MESFSSGKGVRGIWGVYGTLIKKGGVYVIGCEWEGMEI
jgi:hypothetical protein